MGATGITLNAGSGGADLGVDTDGTYDYQIVKIGYSVTGSTPTQVSSSNPLPVVQTGALPAGSNTIGAVTQGTTPWADNVTQLGGNAIKTGSGAGGSGSLSVYIATDQPSLSNAIPVAQSGSWTVSVSGTVAISNSALPAAAALSDSISNPTVTLIGAPILGWDATNTEWRRVQVGAGTGSLATTPGVGTGNIPTDHADTTLSANSSYTIGSNSSRKYVVVYNLSTSAGSIRVRGHGNSSGGVEIQPGQNFSFPVSASLDVIDAGSGSTSGYQEQT